MEMSMTKKSVKKAGKSKTEATNIVTNYASNPVVRDEFKDLTTELN